MINVKVWFSSKSFKYSETCLIQQEVGDSFCIRIDIVFENNIIET